jgi:hypothetical protein
MTLSAFNGTALLLLIVIAAALITIAVRRTSKRIDRDVKQILRAPANPQRWHAHAVYPCVFCGRSVRQCIESPAELLRVVADPIRSCDDCTILAELDRQVSS